MKIDTRKLIVCILIPLAVGGASALLSGGGMNLFDEVVKPPLSPPGWLFPVVWSVLYILMGVASFLVLDSGGARREIENAMTTYGLQLFFNFFWSIIFFNFRLYTFAFVWLVALWILILITTVRFWRISKTAGYLMIPYILWVSFAGYLSLGIAIFN